ncbi:uncharacterized protein LOC131039471 [Cryptomeria japonica]|uniref:uncharacterized protein LOC131039471 n=1 Tax=Cryptomeria japonica TaxID=3369 RepID=UPI0027DA76C8|nr:uncharacterized protein LOC131039471 [Cryptomeria japonica]
MEKLHGRKKSASHGFSKGWKNNRVTLSGQTWRVDEDLVAEVIDLQKDDIKFYRDYKFSGKVKANKDDPFLENAHISKDYDGFDSDEDSSNLPPKKKLRVSENDKEDTEEKVVEEEVENEQEQEKEVEEEAENEKEKEAEGEDGDKDNEQREEEVEESEVKENPYDSDNRDDV